MGGNCLKCVGAVSGGWWVVSICVSSDCMCVLAVLCSVCACY